MPKTSKPFSWIPQKIVECLVLPYFPASVFALRISFSHWIIERFEMLIFFLLLLFFHCLSLVHAFIPSFIHSECWWRM